jgi:hypothetical protein
MPELYHYTNATGLIGILNNRELWATGSGYLNDPTEIVFGARALAARLEIDERAGRTKELVDRALDLLKTQYILPHSPDLLVEDRAFITSFSRSDESLTLWRLYAGRNGFSIGFDEHLLMQWLNKAEMDGANEDVEENEALDRNYQLSAQVEEVLYGEPGIEHLVNAILAVDTTDIDAYAFDYRMRTAFAQLARIKHSAFADEREARIVLRRVGDFAHDESVRISAAGSLVAYRCFQFPHDAIRSITLAPSANVPQQKSALQSLIADGGRGAYAHIDIRSSALPFTW